MKLIRLEMTVPDAIAGDVAAELAEDYCGPEPWLPAARNVSVVVFDGGSDN